MASGFEANTPSSSEIASYWRVRLSTVVQPVSSVPGHPATAAMRSVGSMLVFPDLLATSLVSIETLFFVILDLRWLVKKGYLSFCCLGGPSLSLL